MLAVLRELRQRLHHDGDHLEPEPRPTVTDVTDVMVYIPYSYGHLSVISTYNPIYRMYNPIYNQL